MQASKFNNLHLLPYIPLISTLSIWDVFQSSKSAYVVMMTSQSITDDITNVYDVAIVTQVKSNI